MSFNIVRYFYWTALGFSVILLVLNFGIGLIAMAIFILPLLILHLRNGLSLNNIKGDNTLMIISALNLLAFALIRPDGVHTLSDNGLSAFLSKFGVHAGYDAGMENYYLAASLILLVFQIAIDLKLRKLRIGLKQRD